MDHPILYSFRRCPYAIRARLAVSVSGTPVLLREVVLRNKPESMLRCSAKGTVPVLLLGDGRVIDESVDIMLWALHQRDPEHWLTPLQAASPELQELLDYNDGPFKQALDRYKYADRFPEHDGAYYRQQGEAFLALLEARLKRNRFLLGDRISLADMAIVPFIRQFAHVDLPWFTLGPYSRLAAWLEELLHGPRFQGVMGKYPPWQSGDAGTLWCGGQL